MPKSRKRRTAKAKPNRRQMPKSASEQLRRRFNAPMPGPRPKHPGYNQSCSVNELIEEFGEDGADWLQEEYGRPLTIADFRLEQCIRRDAFIVDDPINGPSTMTAEKISKWLDMTFQVVALMAKDAARQSGVPLPAELAEQLAEQEKDQEAFNHAAEGADTVRGLYLEGELFLNDRGMWDLAGGEA